VAGGQAQHPRQRDADQDRQAGLHRLRREGGVEQLVEAAVLGRPLFALEEISDLEGLGAD
jgi:hypothetical protein